MANDRSEDTLTHRELPEVRSEMPVITGSVYMAQSVDPSHCSQLGMTFTGGEALEGSELMPSPPTVFQYPTVGPWPDELAEEFDGEYQKHEAKLQEMMEEKLYSDEEEEEEMAKAKCRLVRVFIVDTDERIPDHQAILWVSPRMRTYLNNNELYFELDVDVKKLVEDHNKTRAKIVDKDLTREHGREVFLNEIRPKDLWMHVTEEGAK